MRKLTFKGLILSNERAEGTTIEADFEVLFAAHVDHIFNFCNMQLHDRALADDITAEVFERAWEKRHKFNSARGSFTTWIFQIARNRLNDEHRRRRRRTTISLNAQFADHSQSSPEAQVERSEQEIRLLQLMEHLTDDEKMIIASKFGVGLGNKEIARIIDKTEGAIASSIYRAMGKLRDLWEREEDSDE